jgi:CBS domain-containing protein
MTRSPFYCQPETNLASATELMWEGDCGFLPVVENDGKVFGVVTDRDICIALGTRNCLPSDVTVKDVIAAQRLYFCHPDDDIHEALKIMQEAKVRRLPVMTHEGALVGVISMDDIVARSEPARTGKPQELSNDEVVKSFRAITERHGPLPN